MKTLVFLRDNRLLVLEALLLVWFYENPNGGQAEFSRRFDVGAVQLSKLVHRLKEKQLLTQTSGRQGTAKRYILTDAGRAIASNFQPSNANTPP
jgi:DNA-binding MarR family transcriptional regulator